MWSPLQFVDRIMLTNDRPNRQLQYIRLRRVAAGMTLKPIPAEIIRCSEKYAIIDAADGVSGYLLQKDKSFESVADIAVFYIVAKFQYGERTTPSRHREMLPIVHHPSPVGTSDWGSKRMY